MWIRNNCLSTPSVESGPGIFYILYIISEHKADYDNITLEHRKSHKMPYYKNSDKYWNRSTNYLQIWLETVTKKNVPKIIVIVFLFLNGFTKNINVPKLNKYFYKPNYTNKFDNSYTSISSVRSTIFGNCNINTFFFFGLIKILIFYNYQININLFDNLTRKYLCLHVPLINTLYVVNRAPLGIVDSNMYCFDLIYKYKIQHSYSSGWKQQYKIKTPKIELFFRYEFISPFSIHYGKSSKNYVSFYCRMGSRDLQTLWENKRNNLCAISNAQWTMNNEKLRTVLL